MMKNEKIDISNTLIHFLECFDIRHGYGWYGLTLPIIEEIHRYNEKNPDKKIYIRNIKQKRGHLEIYTSKRPEYLDKMIIKAKYESEQICELCGAVGKLVDMYGCSKTVCDEHLKTMLQELEEKNEG